MMKTKELWTVAEMREADHGCFPVALIARHQCEHADEACDQTLRAEYVGSGPGFIAMSECDARRWAQDIAATMDGRGTRAVAMPLVEAMAGLAAWEADMIAATSPTDER